VRNRARVNTRDPFFLDIFIERPTHARLLSTFTIKKAYTPHYRRTTMSDSNHIYAAEQLGNPCRNDWMFICLMVLSLSPYLDFGHFNLSERITHPRPVMPVLDELLCVPVGFYGFELRERHG
jgi:hypothetical protein